jgi:threonine dehydrogenase-like Zn-dependent dehydrogenase
MDKTMLAAVFEGQGKLTVKDVPVPKIQSPDQVLMEVEAAGICGTDLHILDVPPGHPGTPGSILGHEYVGRLLEVGSGVQALKPGDRVVVAPNLYCGICGPCASGRPNQCEHFTTLGVFLNGGFAKYNVAPESALFKISPSLPASEAVYVELLSCIVGGTEKVRLQPGETVAILGAGPVGLMFELVFKAAGAGKIIMTDIAPYRLDYAKKLGADVVVNVKDQDPVAITREATDGKGVDVVVDAVGSLFSQALEQAAVGGKIVLFGMDSQAMSQVHQFDITRKELTVLGTYIGINTFPKAIRMLESGVVKPSALTTHSVSLGQIHDAIEALRAGQGIKAVITP